MKRLTEIKENHKWFDIVIKRDLNNKKAKLILGDYEIDLTEEQSEKVNNFFEDKENEE